MTSHIDATPSRVNGQGISRSLELLERRPQILVSHSEAHVAESVAYRNLQMETVDRDGVIIPYATHAYEAVAANGNGWIPGAMW